MIKAPFRRDRNLTSYLCVVILLQCVLAMMLIPLTVHAQQRIDTCTGKAHDPTPRDILWRNISDAPGMLTACTLSTLPKLRANDAGITAWRYCKGTDGQYRPQWSAVTWDFLRATPGLAKDALALGFSPSDAALHNFAAKHAKTPLDAPELKAVWCPHWPEMTAGIPARLPPTVEAPQPPDELSDAQAAWYLDQLREEFAEYGVPQTIAYAKQHWREYGKPQGRKWAADAPPPAFGPRWKDKP